MIGETCMLQGKSKKCSKFLIGMSEWKTPLLTPMNRWNNNTKPNFEKTRNQWRALLKHMTNTRIP
jgi:hypothetical protein